MHDIRALAAVFAFLLLCGTASASEPSPAAAARGVTQRLLGQRSASVRFELMHDGDSTDVFEYSAKNGVVLVRGSSAVAMTRGLYEYLRARCNCMVAWSGQQLSLPNRFPDCSKTPGSTPYKFRQYFNVCTFGYTTVWWDWKRWEREIDWMALHGINMPLAMNGQEAVWSRVWQSMGLRRDDLREFFTGPAFLPWQRMGNVNRHGGPLSDAWMGRQAELQKLILRRERELGMEPIVPAFSGFVPAAFRALHPEAQITENSAWGNFPKGYQTFVLHPSSPFFQDIGARFIREYDKTFGASHYYLADTFNELAVPVSRNHRYEELAAFGKAVYSSIRAGNPDAVWVMQGWLFGNDQGFWDSPSVAALLKDVPDDRMMILDLCNESFHGWKQHQAFFGKEWIYSLIHNFGGNNPLYGDLRFAATDPMSMLHDPHHGRMMGSGLAPEGIENNEVMYEMMTDAMWTSNTIDISSWTLKYANARYGIDDPSLRKAWELLDKTVYGGSFFNFRHVLQCRPSLNASSNVKDTASIREILRLMLEAPPEAWKSRLFHNDLIDIATRFLAIRADVRLMNACAAERAGASPLRDSLASQALNLMERIDAILGARLDNTLGRWIAAAKTCAADPVESRQFEQNARMQLTIWGGPELYDYASKLWGGMVGGFYAGRWKAFFEALRAGESDDSIRVHLVKWEEQWTMQTGPCESRAVTDLRAEVERDLRDESLMLDLTPTPVISASAPVFLKGDSVVVRIGAYRPEARIRYSVLDKSGAIHWKPYERPFIVHATTKIAAIASSPGMVESLPSELAVYEVDSTNGLRASYFETSVINLSEWKHDSAPMWTGVVFGVGLEEVHHRQDKYVVEYEGEVLIQTEGEYAFSLTSDDGSRLWLDGRLLVDNDGLHGTLEKRGKQNLAKGMHEIRVEYFQAGGGATLCLQCAGPGTGFETISPRVLFRP